MAVPLGLALGGGALLGGLGGLFGGKTKAKPLWLSAGIPKLAERFATAELPALGQANAPEIEAYSQAIASGRPLREALAGEGVSLLGGQLRSAAAYDPLATRERLLEGTLGSVRSFFPDLIGSVNKAVSDRQRLLGIGGRPTSIYGQTALAAALGQSLAPILGGIYSSAGRDAASIESARINNLLATLELLKEREQLPYRSAMAELLPSQARTAELGERIGLLGDVGQALQSSIGGYETRQNPIGAALSGAAGGLGLGAMTYGALSPMGLGGARFGSTSPWAGLSGRAALTRSMVPYAPLPGNYI